MLPSRPKRYSSGFSLVELLVVLAIMAVLAVVVIANINPSKNLADARNAERESDVVVIMNSVHQFLLDTGSLPNGIPIVTMKEICKSGPTGLPCGNGVRLDQLVGTYVAAVPQDPLAPKTGTGTSYWIARDTLGRITIIAAYSERNQNIFMTR